LGEEYGINGSTAYRRSKTELQRLIHCADITRRYCSRFCGILLVDGKYIAIKGYERKIPVVYGIDYLTHDIPHYVLSVAENYPTCQSYFNSLRLMNYPLQAVVSDDNVNIFQAALNVYPKVITQLCQNHYKEGIRDILRVRTETTYVPFMREIEEMFSQRKSMDDFIRTAGKMYLRYGQDDTCQGVLLDIQKRLPQLLAYTKLKRVPRTTNLIESFNSHLEGRLKTIKGFKSFEHADSWLNGYFVRRRLKKFTDCEKGFRFLNGKSSLEQTLKPYYQINTVLKLTT
jgi:transposase-like protein